MDVRFEVGNLVGDGGGEGTARVSITAKFEHALDDIIVHPEGPIIAHMQATILWGKFGRIDESLNADNMLQRILINSLPFFLLALWRFHFGQVYFWFPAQFASQYHPGWTCSTIQVPGGGMCEDVVEWKERGLAILTCDSNRRKWNTVIVILTVNDN